MIKCKQAILSAISNDATTVALLGSGNRVFSQWPDVIEITPCITFFEVSSTPRATRDQFESTYQLDVWADLNSTKADDIAERLYDVFDHTSIIVSDATQVFISRVLQIREGFEDNKRRRSLDIQLFTQK